MSKLKKTSLIDHNAGTHNETINETIKQKNITLPLNIVSSSGFSLLSGKTIKAKQLYAANKAKNKEQNKFVSSI